MAMRAGQYFAASLWCSIRGVAVSPFRPQKNWLTLLNLGDAEAIGNGAPNPVLFDPQTCRPLMIAAPSAIAHKVIQQWSAIGPSSQCVGTLTTETS